MIISKKFVKKLKTIKQIENYTEKNAKTVGAQSGDLLSGDFDQLSQELNPAGQGLLEHQLRDRPVLDFVEVPQKHVQIGGDFVEVVATEHVVYELIVVQIVEQLPPVECQVIGEVLRRELLQLLGRPFGGAVLFGERSQGVQVVGVSDEYAAVHCQRRRYTDLSVAEW
jgi:hypothetical protein